MNCNKAISGGLLQWHGIMGMLEMNSKRASINREKVEPNTKPQD